MTAANDNALRNMAGLQGLVAGGLHHGRLINLSVRPLSGGSEQKVSAIRPLPVRFLSPVDAGFGA